MSKIARVTMMSENGGISKVINVEISELDALVLKHYDMEEYDEAWDRLISKLETVPFPTDDWYVDHLEII